MPRKKTSVREIAKLCNVSPSTVSRVLNKSGSISEETSQKILAIAKELNYITEAPEETSKPFISILHPYIGIPMMSDIEKDLEDRFAKAEYSTVFSSFKTNNTIDSYQKKTELLQMLCQQGTLGVVIFTDDLSDFELPKLSVPVVYVTLEDVQNRGEHTYCVSYDFVIGGHLAAEELLRKGCTQPIVLLNSHTTSSNAGRYSGFCKAFEDAGYPIPASNIIVSDHTRENFAEAHDMIHYLAAKKVTFDSIYAGSDWRAYGALTALKELNIKVPDEVKVIGFDGSAIAIYNSTPITSVALNPHSVAQHTYSMLQSLMNKETPPAKHVIVPVQLFMGKTT